MRALPRIRCCAAGAVITLGFISVMTQSVAQAPVPPEQLAGAALERGPGLVPLGMPSKDVPPAFAALPYHSSIKAEGGVGPYRVVITGDLPPGVVYEPGYSVVTFSGVPTATGSFDSQVTIIDSNGAQVTHPYNITVRPQPQIANPPAPPPELFVTDPEHITTTDADNIFFPAVVNIAEHVTTADSDADFSPIMFADPEHITTTDTTVVFFAEILPDPEHITTTDTTAIVTEVGVLPATVPGGTVNSAYPATIFTAAGATGAATLTPSGTLPTGMTFSAPGSAVLLSGTPAQGGIFSFTITVKDTVHTDIVTYTLTINTASQTITVGALPSPTYGGAAFTLTATSSSGLPVTITSTSALATGANPFASVAAGVATFQATQAGNSSYSTATPVNFSVTIAPATLSVTAGSISRIFDQPNPAFTTTITGFVNGDTSSVVSGAPTISTAATPISSVSGSPYAITPALGTLAATNYSFSFVTGSLSIKPTTQTITFYPIANLTHGTTFELSARSSSGLPSTYTVTGGTITGNILTVGAAGPVTVTATQAGNANYSAATSVMRSFTAQ